MGFGVVPGNGTLLWPTPPIPSSKASLLGGLSISPVAQGGQRASVVGKVLGEGVHGGAAGPVQEAGGGTPQLDVLRGVQLVPVPTQVGQMAVPYRAVHVAGVLELAQVRGMARWQATHWGAEAGAGTPARLAPPPALEAPRGGCMPMHDGTATAAAAVGSSRQQQMAAPPPPPALASGGSGCRG